MKYKNINQINSKEIQLCLSTSSNGSSIISISYTQVKWFTDFSQYAYKEYRKAPLLGIYQFPN